MNYRKKKKLFQHFTFLKLKNNSTFIMFFQANTMNSLNQRLLTKESNKLNLKLKIYQTKLLRQKKFIFEENFTKNSYSGLFLVLSTNSTDYINNIQVFFKLLKNFTFLLPIYVMFLKRLFFNNQLQKILQFPNFNGFLIFLLLRQIFLFFHIIKIKIQQ